MKNCLLFAALLALSLRGYSQHSLQAVITNSDNTTKHFIRLPQNMQVPFQLNQISKILGLDNHSALILKTMEKDALGITNYRFYETYMGIPVNRSMYVISVKAGKIVALSGSIIIHFDTDNPPANNVNIDPEQAITNATRYVGAATYMWQVPAMEAALQKIMKNTSASYYPVAEKCWYYAGDQIDPQHLKLAYKVDVFAEQPYSRAYYFVDAMTGAILNREDRIETADTLSYNAISGANTLYSGQQNINTEYIGRNVMRLHDIIRGTGIFTLHGEANKFGGDYFLKSQTDVFDYTLPNQNSLDVHWGVEKAFDFYKAVFGRNSIDNNGYRLYSFVNRRGSLYNNNAVWDGSVLNFGTRTDADSAKGYGVTGIDVIGHELTHGVTQNTSELLYSNEPGAINESMSDIMGKTIQFYTKPSDIDWRFSNDMHVFVRDMSNPNAYNQPDTYQGNFWKTESGDNGGVHTNSGVGDFMYYLLVNGGAGTNDIGNMYTVQGLGITRAEAILYRTETVYLTPNAQYADWRDACISAATDLYGASTNEVAQVENAWYAVGVGTSGGVTYCSSGGLSTQYEYINRIVLNTVDNTSGDNGGRGDYTGLSTNLTAGTIDTIKVQGKFPIISPRSEFWTVYIDYNDDGIFNDTTEKAVTKLISNTGLISIAFRVPVTAKNGSTRMRVQMNHDSPDTQPCDIFQNGEVEDYTVNILGGNGLDAAASRQSLLSNLSVSPNPVSASSVRLTYTLLQGGPVVFTLHDASGVTWKTYTAGYQAIGVNTYVVNNLSSLHNGYYYLTVQQNGLIAGKINLLIAH